MELFGICLTEERRDWEATEECSERLSLNFFKGKLSSILTLFNFPEPMSLMFLFIRSSSLTFLNIVKLLLLIIEMTEKEEKVKFED